MRTYGREIFSGGKEPNPQATLERLSRVSDAARGPRSGSRGSRSDIARKRSGQTPRVTIFAKQKYVTVFSKLST
jgi:hypothetical protein